MVFSSFPKERNFYKAVVFTTHLFSDPLTVAVKTIYDPIAPLFTTQMTSSCHIVLLNHICPTLLHLLSGLWPRQKCPIKATQEVINNVKLQPPSGLMVFFQLVPPLARRRRLLCLFPQKFSTEASALQSRATLPLTEPCGTGVPYVSLLSISR